VSWKLVKSFGISDRQKRAQKLHPKSQFRYKIKYILKKQTIWLNREGLEHKHVETGICHRPRPVYSRPTLQGRWRTSSPCSPRQSLRGTENIIITYTWLWRCEHSSLSNAEVKNSRVVPPLPHTPSWSGTWMNQMKVLPLGLRRMYTDSLINPNLDVYTA
jgi:hypothetical protein